MGERNTPRREPALGERAYRRLFFTTMLVLLAAACASALAGGERGSGRRIDFRLKDPLAGVRIDGEWTYRPFDGGQAYTLTVKRATSGKFNFEGWRKDHDEPVLKIRRSSQAAWSIGEFAAGFDPCIPAGVCFLARGSEEALLLEPALFIGQLPKPNHPLTCSPPLRFFVCSLGAQKDAVELYTLAGHEPEWSPPFLQRSRYLGDDLVAPAAGAYTSPLAPFPQEVIKDLVPKSFKPGDFHVGTPRPRGSVIRDRAPEVLPAALGPSGSPDADEAEPGFSRLDRPRLPDGTEVLPLGSVIDTLGRRWLQVSVRDAGDEQKGTSLRAVGFLPATYLMARFECHLERKRAEGESSPAPKKVEEGK